MKITIISLDNWGFNKYIAEAFRSDGHKVTNIDFNKFKYSYPNSFYRIYNFLLKALFKKNLKTRHHGQKIIEKLESLGEKQDLILTIKADHIDLETLKNLKKYTTKSVAFFNDNSKRCPKIVPTIPLFDKVFSFEKEDCDKYGLDFCTNWIYNYTPDTNNTSDFEYQVFNITSKDRRRLPLISRIAAELKRKKIAFKIIIFDKKNTDKDPNLDFITSKLPLDEVNDFISRSQSLLDIHREGQSGLTFRVFESLGLEKKLITTNKDIVNYDFYNPDNILVIDAEKPVIPTDFFESKYQKISSDILDKYFVHGWINELLKKLQ